MRYGDTPINDPSDDLFRRSDFALNLARAIDQTEALTDGFVIGLVGEWGHGKTSVIHLLRRYLLHFDMIRRNITGNNGHDLTLDKLEKYGMLYARVDYIVRRLNKANKNPTMWEESDRLRKFHEVLGSTHDVEKADQYFRLKERALENPTTIVVTFSPWMIAGRVELASALLAELGRSLSAELGPDVKRAFGSLLQRLAEFSPIAGAGFDLLAPGFFGPVIRAVGGWSGGIGGRLASGPTLDSIRTQLRSVLQDLNGRRILVIIDDLDRLMPDEAVQMIGLVKTLGDLPNTVYILSYDEIRLEKLVGASVGSEGASQYLEKIVQYKANLPILDRDDLLIMLDNDLDKLLPNLDNDEKNRIQIIWYEVLSKYLNSPRSIRRFVNSISVSLPSLSGFVDRVDLLLLEALRVFEPDVYQCVKSNLFDLVDA